MTTLPPLQTLRAFEAAARHGSYTRAAEELGLTHGAVSHHIARLERDLGGTRLFVRDGQRMMLTEAGQRLVMDIRRGLAVLSDALQRTQARPIRRANRRVLTVSVLPGFATCWLVPRLSRFQAAYSDIDVAVLPTPGLATLDRRDGVDLAIRYGPGRWSGLRAQPLLPGVLFPVCSPTFQKAHDLARPEQLGDVPLLRCPRQRWSVWFAAAGLSFPEPRAGPSYDDAGMTIQAAVDGQGVALARAALAVDEVAAGRLVQPFGPAVEDDFAWYVVRRMSASSPSHELEAFVRWLVSEAASSVSVAPQREGV